MEVVVMHKTNIQLDSAKVGTDAQGNAIYGGKMPFRWRGEISREEYDAICKLDEMAGREPRLMDLSKPAIQTEPVKRPRGRPRKVVDEE